MTCSPFSVLPAPLLYHGDQMAAGNKRDVVAFGDGKIRVILNSMMDI